MPTFSVNVHPVRHAELLAELDQRAAIRRACGLEATSRQLDSLDTLSWGGTIQDISPGGLGLTLCYPFSAGTHLAIDLQTANGHHRSLLVKVVHVQDQSDGTWQLGCEFVKPISGSAVDILI